LAAVVALGDNQYECGGAIAYTQSYDPSWGRVKALTKPIPGNREYTTSISGGTNCDATGKAAGYYHYFGASAGDPGRGYYSFTIGSWHVIALNSNCGAVGGCGTGSAQETWLKGNLAANPTACTLAYFHHPRFSSSLGSDLSVSAFWHDLYNAGVDVILNGHAHNYERFAPQSPSGAADSARGIREFVVGTGGRSFHSFSTTASNSQVRNSNTFGVLELTLNASSYSWRFVPESGKTFSDTGSTACH
jgi:hypothetical protein